MRKLLVILVCLCSTGSVYSQAPGCPNIQVADETVSCNNPCVDLVATYLQTGETTQYEVSSIPYAPPYPFSGGTPTFVGIDDTWSGIINIPFDFCFYGVSYNQLVIGANGLISFDPSLANAGCNWGYSSTIPSTPTTTGPYENAIHGAYLDIDPSVGGDINYATLGTAPCRTFVVNFNSVPNFNCNSLLVTQQIVIYETTNAIEVYIEDKPTCTSWNNGNAVIGIQNIGATQGLCPPARNTGPWTTTQEAWRFTPNGTPNYVVEWFDVTGASQGFGDTLTVCTQVEDYYTAEITYTNCNGTIITESATNTVLVDANAGQIASLGLLDTIKSCNPSVTINADLTLDTYLWNTGETTSSISVNSSGNYILEATQGGCDGDDTVYVSIVNANILEDDFTICNLETTDLNIQQTNTFVNWSTSENSEIINISPSVDTEYWVEISDGVTLCKDSVFVSVNELPTVEIGGINKICRGDSTSLTIVFTGSQPFSISLNSTIETFNSYNNFLFVSPISTTNYEITYIEDVNCTNDSIKSHTINVNPTPIAIISPSESTIYENEEINLTAGNYTLYEWYTANDSLISTEEVLTVTDPGSFYIWVQDANGCTDYSDIAIVNMVPITQLFVPNTFTPNSDEHNELFVIKGYNIITYNLKVFNKWGEQLFESDSIEKYWDGKYNNKQVQQDTYYYKIEVLGEDREIFIKTGTVNVVY